MKVLSMILLLSLSPAVFAHGGEDHGAPTPAVTQAIAPRATAGTEEFEAVLIQAGKQLLLYLDHAATNEPVVGATVEIDGGDGGGVAGRAVESAPGVYAVDTQALAPAKHALTISIETGDSADLMTATLDLSAPHADVEHAHGWREWLAWIAAGLLGLAAGTLWMIRRRKQPKGLK